MIKSNVPDKKGWKRDNTGDWYCPVCGKPAMFVSVPDDYYGVYCHIEQRLTDFCPHCGNDMRINLNETVKVKPSLPEVYVVTYWEKNEQPIISVFGNEAAARRYFKYESEKHQGICLDKCPIYNHVEINE